MLDELIEFYNKPTFLLSKETKIIDKFLYCQAHDEDISPLVKYITINGIDLFGDLNDYLDEIIKNIRDKKIYTKTTFKSDIPKIYKKLKDTINIILSSWEVYAITNFGFDKAELIEDKRYFPVLADIYMLNLLILFEIYDNKTIEISKSENSRIYKLYYFKKKSGDLSTDWTNIYYNQFYEKFQNIDRTLDMEKDIMYKKLTTNEKYLISDIIEKYNYNVEYHQV
jgi:hypothetical protein